MNARDALPDLPHPPAPLPALAPYLEKLRDFPPGQILLGIVGVHGCAARALGAGGEAPRLRRPGLGLAGSGMSTVQPPLSRANTRSARPAQARDPLFLSPRAVVSALSPPPPRCQPQKPGCGLGATASRAPRQRGRQGRGGGNGGGKTGRRTQGSSPPASPAQRAALCAFRSSDYGGGQSRSAGWRGVRGWGRARAGSRSHTPPCRPAALGTQEPGTWWPKEQSWGF